MTISFKKAHYIKLGREGVWETDSIATGRMRIGWEGISLLDINLGKWDAIERQVRSGWPLEKKGTATRDFNRLKEIAESTDQDVWVTFHGSRLWWARLKKGPIRQDKISKYRETLDGWHDMPVSGDRKLLMNELPGKIVAMHGFRGTVCNVTHPEILSRVISGDRSHFADKIAAYRKALIAAVEDAVSELHWKDYEMLVDMVFRHAGWVRISVLGQQDKGYDLELREPILGDRYVVQVKSRATLADLLKTAAQFSPDVYRKVFFVVHSPAKDLSRSPGLLDAHVELVPPTRLAELTVNAGLVTWLEDKVA